MISQHNNGGKSKQIDMMSRRPGRPTNQNCVRIIVTIRGMHATGGRVASERAV